MNEASIKTDKMGGGLRSCNFEIFRILSMLMIVAHHYVVNSGLIDCIEAQTELYLHAFRGEVSVRFQQSVSTCDGHQFFFVL